ncbi:aKG-HExxH-type peptide beta-hydroxylase [Streptomyces sp. NPDC055094]
MHVEPDAREATRERTGLVERMRAVLLRAELAPPPEEALRHPAAAETVHTAQHALRSGALGQERRATLSARLGALTAPSGGPAEPAGHLRRSLARALRSLPAPRSDGPPRTAATAAWTGREREVLADALALLAAAWPRSAAEIRETVAEVALLEGNAIDGYTDFAVHGAIFLNRVRLTPGDDGLPAAVRCAEAVLHEATHTRCNAAAVAQPFLLPERASGEGGAGTGTGGPLLVATPLRADPRPLSGLFQQTVVLARIVCLYERLDQSGEAVARRRERVTASARQAVHTLAEHEHSLTPRGGSVLASCAVVAEGGR